MAKDVVPADDVVAPVAPAKPVDVLKDKALAPGQVKVMVGDTTFITRVEDVVVPVREWCLSNHDRYPATLLGAFESVMRARGLRAAKPADIEAAYDKFKNEPV